MDLSPAHPFSLFFANLIGSMPAEYMQENIQIFPIDSNEGMIGHIGPVTVSFFPKGGTGRPESRTIAKTKA